ncbi:MAG: RHS repeat-associated core domain-containing protein [Bacteroidales bacterium]
MKTIIATEQQYFYHPDHLGSSSFITDASGNAHQHLQYLPFGEDFISQRIDWQTRYTFSAKEKDKNTGCHYFGARYYDSEVSVWLSVDPLADKYPGMSPYMYTAGNPVMLVDPDGRTIWITGNDGATDVEYKQGMEYKV